MQCFLSGYCFVSETHAWLTIFCRHSVTLRRIAHHGCSKNSLWCRTRPNNHIAVLYSSVHQTLQRHSAHGDIHRTCRCLIYSSMFAIVVPAGFWHHWSYHLLCVQQDGQDCTHDGYMPDYNRNSNKHLVLCVPVQFLASQIRPGLGYKVSDRRRLLSDNMYQLPGISGHSAVSNEESHFRNE